jgi:tetratricopeptide (TPR) repeat protein
MVTNDELRAALEWVARQEGSDGDLQLLRQALERGEITAATGERAVNIGRDATEVVIATGDGIVVNVFKGVGARTLAEVAAAVAAVPTTAENVTRSVTGAECAVVDGLLAYLEDKRLITEEAGYQSHFPDHLRISAEEIRRRTNEALQVIGRHSPLTPILRRIQKGARDFQQATEGAADGSRMHGGLTPYLPSGLSSYLRSLEAYRQEIAEGMMQAAQLCGFELDPVVLAAFRQGQETLHAASEEMVGDGAGQAAPLTTIGMVYHGTGRPEQALECFNQALHIMEEVGDRAGQAGTLNNIGQVYRSIGQPEQALEYYHQALPIQEEVGDRAGERVTRYNLAMIYRAQGKLREAVEELKQVVELDQLVQSPDLESDRAMLAQVQEEIDAL